MPDLSLSIPVFASALNAGMFISPGRGGRHPKRIIDSYEIIMMRSGTLHMREGKSEFVLGANDTLLLFPGVEHEGLSEYIEDTSFYWIHFRLSDAEGSPRRASSATETIVVPQKTTPARPERMIDLFRRFLHDQEDDFACRYEADLIVATMLVELACHNENDRPGQKALRIVERTKATIETTFRQPETSPGSIAATLDVNSDYLGRIFRQATGKTLGQYLLNRRLRESRKLLQETDLTISQIALRVGFADGGYFRRQFRRCFDATPGDIRRLHFRGHINTT